MAVRSFVFSLLFALTLHQKSIINAAKISRVSSEFYVVRRNETSSVEASVRPEGHMRASSNSVMGTWITITTFKKSPTRRQRATPGCENLPSPYYKNLGSMKIEWNVRDSYKVHSMCKAVFFWNGDNCYGDGIYWPLTADPNKYDYQDTSYGDFSGKFAQIRSIQCDFVGPNPTPVPSPSNPCASKKCPSGATCQNVNNKAVCTCKTRGYVIVNGKCVPKKTPSPPPKVSDMGCLAPHNNARAAVGVAGLQWSNTLAKAAKQWADHLRDDNCGFYHSGGKYGENLYAASGFVPTCENAVSSWVDERQFYHYDSNSCDSGEVCGHYTQVVWRNSKNVGCAMSTCAEGAYPYIWVCEYDPPGNWVGERPY